MAEHNDNIVQDNAKNLSEKESSIQQEEHSPKKAIITIKDFFLPSKNQIVE